MMGLREYLLCNGEIIVEDLDEFSPEVNYNLVVLNFTRKDPISHIVINREVISREAINLTANRSWGIRHEFTKYFMGWPVIGDYFQCSSGMTIGNNEYFIRPILEDMTVEEPYQFTFIDVPFTVEEALQNARLNKLGPNALRKAEAREAAKEMVRKVQIYRRDTPMIVSLPSEDYRPYNKASRSFIYEDPSHMVYWRDAGDAVLTFKKTGPWYLRGVGGQPFFGCEGVTWSLVASRIWAKYLPQGRILDSGAPVAIPRPGTDRSEIFFLLGWLVTDRATQLLKTVLNHTRNIQGKDIERLPYPAWVSDNHKEEAIGVVEELVESCMNNGPVLSKNGVMTDLETLYSLDNTQSVFSLYHKGVANDERAIQLSFM